MANASPTTQPPQSPAHASPASKALCEAARRYAASADETQEILRRNALEVAALAFAADEKEGA